MANRLLDRAHLKAYASVVIVVLTVTAFSYYITKHPQVVQTLKQLSPALLLLLLTLYACMQLSLVAVYSATLRLCRKRLPLRENILLTNYSSLVNFFGPLQSGPGLRAIYLKKRLQLSLKTYTVATLIYYAWYGFFSALALTVGSNVWWIGVLILLVAGAVAWAALPRLLRRFNLDSDVLAALATASLLQVIIFGLLYFSELHSINNEITVRQAMSYAGTANLSLFASLTPGAIGIREAFLFFTQNLHHVPDTTIVAASVIDRAVNILFLGILAITSFATHAKQQLRPGQTPTAGAED